ncbi:SEA domain-containing protein [Ditylenchus destructor]|uniref:SEA domain-containing protein n=1 Tax=Ditylenchus destructor TaxID=166010 RepID=A0AAD4QZ92_9BILA|nr:SEA domain-containing protein [Ditylenchus destructor]
MNSKTPFRFRHRICILFFISSFVCITVRAQELGAEELVTTTKRPLDAINDDEIRPSEEVFKPEKNREPNERTAVDAQEANTETRHPDAAQLPEQQSAQPNDTVFPAQSGEHTGASEPDSEILLNPTESSNSSKNSQADTSLKGTASDDTPSHDNNKSSETGGAVAENDDPFQTTSATSEPEESASTPAQEHEQMEEQSNTSDIPIVNTGPLLVNTSKSESDAKDGEHHPDLMEVPQGSENNDSATPKNEETSKVTHLSSSDSQPESAVNREDHNENQPQQPLQTHLVTATEQTHSMEATAMETTAESLNNEQPENTHLRIRPLGDTDEHPLTTAEPNNTEEQAQTNGHSVTSADNEESLIAGDKSVFNAEEPLSTPISVPIGHSESELNAHGKGEPEHSKNAQPNDETREPQPDETGTVFPPPHINTGSDGFPVITTNNDGEPKTGHDHHQHSHSHPALDAAQHEKEIANAMKTPFSVRLSNIDFMPDFEDPKSGVFRKLRDQISGDLTKVLQKTLGAENYVDFEITAMRKGSVIVEGQILSKEELSDIPTVASRLEEAITENGGNLGGNQVDVKAVRVDGIQSKGTSNMSDSNAIAAASNTGLIVGGSIAIGVLILVFAIFAVIVFGVNNRRSNKRTLKLKEEMAMAENGRSPYRTSNANGNDGVNLMKLTSTSGIESNGNANGRTNGATANPPMILNGSQFSSPNAFRPVS